MGTTRRLGVTLLTAGTLAGSLAGTQALAAAGANPCRVRNVTDGAVGSSLKRMVGVAHDGDRLRVWGTCAGQVVIKADLVITGMGDGATLTGRDEHRVVRVRPATTVTLRHLTIERGWRPDNFQGGGIYNAGTLTIEDALVRDNRASHNGGGIRNRGVMTIEASVIEGNWSIEDGGILNDGTLSMTDSIVRRNHAKLAGGINNAGEMTLTRVVVAANVARKWGGGIVGDQLTIVGSVIRDNRAGTKGGGFVLYGDFVTIVQSVVRDNRAGTTGGGFDSGVRLTLTDTAVKGNSAHDRGGGILNRPYGGASVTLEGSSFVTGNTPDDCVGTPAC